MIEWDHSLNTFTNHPPEVQIKDVKKSKQLNYGSGSQEINLTQWGSHIMKSILMSHMMVIQNPQNVHKVYFEIILMTFLCDIWIGLIVCESHCVIKLFFCETPP